MGCLYLPDGIDSMEGKDSAEGKYLAERKHPVEGKHQVQVEEKDQVERKDPLEGKSPLKEKYLVEGKEIELNHLKKESQKILNFRSQCANHESNKVESYSKTNCTG